MESPLDWEGSDVGLGVLRRTGTGVPVLNVEVDVPWDVGVLTVPPVVPPVALLHAGTGRTHFVKRQGHNTTVHNWVSILHISNGDYIPHMQSLFCHVAISLSFAAPSRACANAVAMYLLHF